MSSDENEEAYRDLLDLETSLDELAQTPGWQALNGRARQIMDEQRKRLLGGEVDSHEAYIKLAWQLRGAEWVLTGILEQVRASIKEYRRQSASIERGQEQ